MSHNSEPVHSGVSAALHPEGTKGPERTRVLLPTGHSQFAVNIRVPTDARQADPREAP